MTERPHLKVVTVDTDTGEHEEMCESCVEKDMAIRRLTRSYEGTIRRLEAEAEKRAMADPHAKDIREVLEFWRERCMPKAWLVAGGDRWKKVAERLKEKDLSGELAFNALSLKAAVVGALLSDWHVQNRHLDAVTIFRDSQTVEKHISRAVEFKRTTGESALLVVDELAGESLRWLAERCACGHLQIEHLRGGPTPDGRQPCSAHDPDTLDRTCPCENMDWFSARVERHMAEMHDNRGGPE